MQRKYHENDNLLLSLSKLKLGFQKIIKFASYKKTSTDEQEVY